MKKADLYFPGDNLDRLCISFAGDRRKERIL